MVIVSVLLMMPIEGYIWLNSLLISNLIVVMHLKSKCPITNSKCSAPYPILNVPYA